MSITKEELNKKWWHRFANVIIYSIAALIFIISIFAIYESKEHKFIINFEKDYQSVKQDERNLKDVSGRIYKSEILDRFMAAYPDKPLTLPDAISAGKLIKSLFPAYKDLTDEEVGKRFLDKYPDLKGAINEFRSQGVSDDKIFTEITSTELGSRYQIKEWDGYDPSVFWWLLAGPITYLLLSLFYSKVIIYIAFGNK